MSIDNINWNILTDPEVVSTLGTQLKKMRLAQNKSQAEVATSAGLNRTTIVKLEAGRPATLTTLVQVLRALGRLELLDAFEQRSRLSPMQIMEQEETYQKKQRKRASKPRKPKPDPEKPSSSW